MAYANTSDLELGWGAGEVLRSSDRDSDQVTDPGVLTYALSQASGEMDGYLAQAYELPLAEPYPVMLVRLCVDIALYRLSPGVGPYTKEKRVRYDDAIRQLTMIAEGKLGIGLGPNGEDPGISGAEAASDAEARDFTRETMASGGIL